MAPFALNDATVWIHGLDFTTKSNSLQVNVEGDNLDVTTFGGSGWRQYLMGLKEVSSEHSGFLDDEVDTAAWDGLGKIDRAVTASPTGAVGDPAYMYRAGQFSYSILGTVGEAAPFSINMSSSNAYGVVRGKIAAAPTAVSNTGVLGSVVELTAPQAGQYVYAVVHAFSIGTTVTVQVQRAATSGFTSPSTVGSIGPITATGGFWMARVAGPFTDAYYRLNVSAVTGSCELAGAIAVQ